MTSSSTHPSILIAGAGPTGLVLALSLLQNGVSVRIIDKVPQHRGGTRGSGIMPRTLEIYDSLGVIQEITKAALPTPPMALHDGSKILKVFQMSEYIEPTPACPYTNFVLLGQNRSEEILRAALHQFSCSVELDTELVSFEEGTDGVTAHILKRCDGHETTEIVKYGFIVGADGARGVSRSKLGLKFLGKSRTENVIVGDMSMEGLDTDHWHLWGDLRTKFISIRPTEVPGVFNFIVTGLEIDHEVLFSSREALLKFLQETTGMAELKYGETLWISHYSPNIRMVNTFRKGRVFVAGDAAHVHSPSGGQGMNSSVQDAFNLGWKLALVQKGLAPMSLLDTYTEERLPVIAEMLKQTTELLDKTVSRSIAEDQSGWKRDASLLQLGVNYRWSSIVVDEQTSSDVVKNDPYGARSGRQLHAGDRAPDVPGLVYAKGGDDTSTTSLFKIFGPARHTVLVFSQSLEQASPILAALDTHPEGLVRSVVIRQNLAPSGLDDGTTANFLLDDKKGHAYEAYQLSEGCFVVVVRPDGVIGAIVRGKDGLERYFAGIFTS